MQMRIDFEATRHNFRLIRPGRYCDEKGLSLQTLDRILRGNYPFTSGEKYQQVIEQLRTDGFLVETPVDAKLAA